MVYYRCKCIARVSSRSSQPVKHVSCYASFTCLFIYFFHLEKRDVKYSYQVRGSGIRYGFPALPISDVKFSKCMLPVK